MGTIRDFGDTAKGLARNPLGIIALFIVLIYGLASLVVGFSSRLEGGDRLPLIWFLVVFPCLVLVIFAWLVSQHHTKLYAPSDYKGDEAFVEVSRASYRAAVSLGAATAKWAADDVSPAEFDRVTSETAERISRAAPAIAARDYGRRHVLWVDDRPENNLHERRALTSFGVEFVLSMSTEDALDKIETSAFDAIISDMGRPPDPRAGYTLLRAVRQAGINIPFIIYAGSRSPEHLREAASSGAQGTTNRPDELFTMVLNAVGLDRQKR